MKTIKEVTQDLSGLTDEQLKAIALMQFNGEKFTIKEDEIFDENDDIVEPIEGDEERDNYMVLTDDEADERATEIIKQSLWAFTPSFLSERTELDPEVFEAIQSNGKCEENNDTIYNLIEKLDSIEEFVSAAISADGRGHFMNSYDGLENEERVNGQTFYIYRMG